MTLTLYNTLTRKKEPFEPLSVDNVRMYVCGPTVYDFAHIGNARPVIVFDVLFRLLRHVYGDDHVTYVRNITDVDDKINARALQDYPDFPLNDAIRKVTEKTANQFHQDVAALGCLEPTIEPRATDNIAQMIEMIEALVKKGHAYVAEGEVLFDVASMADYGALSGRNLEDQQAGARVAVEDHKRNAGDFVLWKQSSAEEPGWDSPWGRGRPGWHIECSAMSGRYLGQEFDIHGGGLDLIFPHHENEIAQSRCAHGTGRMARVWMHNGFLEVEGEKMSKSLGNFITIHELLAGTSEFNWLPWPGDAIRFAMLSSHYRQPIDFTENKLAEAGAVMHAFQLLGVRAGLDPNTELNNVPLVADAQPTKGLLNCLKDDLNTPAVFYTHFSALKSVADSDSDQSKKATMDLLGDMFFLGLDPFRYVRQENAAWRMHHNISDVEIDSEISARLSAIKDKDWATADQIRDRLSEKGIQLKDGKDPETGERVTTWEIKR